jgi:disulfide bond formation protein DsbB
MKMPTTRQAALLGALIAGFALCFALASEYWGGLVPCALCLWERWPYRVAIALGAAGVLLPRKWLVALLLPTMLVSAGLGFVHVGVEQGWWPSPLPECASPLITGGSIAERLARMPALPAKPCDEPTYLIPFLPVSFAAMNFLFALACAAALAIWLRCADKNRT